MFVTESTFKKQIQYLRDDNRENLKRIDELEVHVSFLKNAFEKLTERNCKELSKLTKVEEAFLNMKIPWADIILRDALKETEPYTLYYTGQTWNITNNIKENKNDVLNYNRILDYSKHTRTLSKQISFNLNQKKIEFKEFILFSTSHPNIFEVFFHGAFIKTIGTIQEFKEVYKFFEGEEL